MIPTVLALLMQATPAASSNPFPPASPREVGLDPAAVRELASRVRTWVEQDDAVGAELLVIKNRRTVLHEAYGLADLDDRTPLGRNTIACIRSMSKPIVGTAVQILADEGKLAIDDPVARYLPSFANEKSDRVTIRQLLTHTAGFPITIVDRALSAYRNGRAIADQAGATGPSLKPGDFNYSDTDTEILASIVGQIAGEPAEAFIKRRILDPLGMTDTYPMLTPSAPVRARVSSNHAGGPATWHKYWDNEDAPFFPIFLGAAGMYSTPVDYARFLAMWMDRGRGPAGRILSAPAVERALTAAIAMIEDGSPYPTRFPGSVRAMYGEHWMIYDGIPTTAGSLPAFGHDGSDGTAAWAFPDRDLMVLLFTQSRGGVAVIRAQRFVGAVAGLSGPPAPTLVPPSATEIEAVLGGYKGASGYAYAVRQRSRVALQMGDTLAILRWPDPQGRWAIDGALGSAGVSFTRDAGGAITGFDLLTVGAKPMHFERRTPATDLPRAEDVMKPVAFPAALRFAGTLTIAGLEGKVEIVAASGGRLASTVAIGATRERTVLDGRSGWRTNGEGMAELRGAFLEQVQLAHPYVRYGDRSSPRRSLTVDRRDRLNGEDVWVLRAAARELPPSTWYVSVASGRLLREEAWIQIRGVGFVGQTAEFDDYRAVGSIELPMRVSSVSSVTGKRTIHYTTVEAVKAEESVFHVNPTTPQLPTPK